MKKITLPFGGSILTTLALMLLLIVMACENDDENPIVADPILKFHLGPDLNVVVGEPTTLKSADPRGQFFHPPTETVWAWRLLDQPDNSQAELADADKVSAIFKPDVPGEYQIELSGSFKEHLVIDTLLAYAHSVATLDGNYQVLVETDGIINSLYVFQDKLYAGGVFSSIGGVEAYGIAAYDGTNWKPLESGFQEDYNTYYGGVSDLIEYQGELYVTGTFGTAGGIESPAVARWDGHQWTEVPGIDLSIISGNGDPAWGPYVYLENYGYSLAVFQDELFIEGYFRNRGQAQLPPYYIMRWDGNLMTGFSMPFPLAGLKVYANHLYAISDYNLASFDGSDWEKLVAVNNEGEMISVSMVPFQEKLLLSVTNEIRGLEFFTWDGTQLDSGIPFSRKHYNYISTSKEIDNTLYIGGAFYEEVVGAKSRGMVTWDGEKWGVVANGPDVIINEIQQFQDQLFVAGYFNGSDNHKIAIWQPK